MPQAQRTNRILTRDTFRFRELPIEVQLRVFQTFKPPVAPEPWTRYAAPNPVTDQIAINMLCLNKSTFKDFAPHLYQYHTIRFKDPVAFANDFLLKSTNACLYNLRYLRCIIYETECIGSDTALHRLRKLTEAVNTWTELKALHRFELIFVPSRATRNAIYANSMIPHSQESGLRLIDETTGGILGAFERRASRTFRGFQVERQVNINEPGFVGEIMAMVLTFSRAT